MTVNETIDQVRHLQPGGGVPLICGTQDGGETGINLAELFRVAPDLFDSLFEVVPELFAASMPLELRDSSEILREEIVSPKQNGQTQLIVAFDRTGRTTGFIQGLTHVTEHDEAFGFVEGVAVRPVARGRQIVIGLGRAFLETADRYAAARGHKQSAVFAEFSWPHPEDPNHARDIALPSASGRVMGTAVPVIRQGTDRLQLVPYSVPSLFEGRLIEQALMVAPFVDGHRFDVARHCVPSVSPEGQLLVDWNELPRLPAANLWRLLEWVLSGYAALGECFDPAHLATVRSAVEQTLAGVREVGFVSFADAVHLRPRFQMKASEPHTLSQRPTQRA